MRGFIPGDGPLVFPPGTTVERMENTWSQYVNHDLNQTWIAYSVPNGTQIMQLPGIRTRNDRNFAGLQSFIEQRQATACAECGD